MSDSGKPLHISIPKDEKLQSESTTEKIISNVELPIDGNANNIKSDNYFDFPPRPEASTLDIEEKRKIDVNERIDEPKAELFDLNEAKAALNRLGNNLKANTFPKQMGLGTSTGILAGFLSMKVGRLSALAVGGGIILYEIAHHNKIVTKDLESISKQIKEKDYFNNPKAKKVMDLFAHVKKFAGRNKIFSIALLGGFLVGTGINY
ncbi:FUN14 domain-containing protein 1-like [Harmonia axyridis]|uniref:FUN14 domain-containing protein 1-like n=1 Tax=Harmonia axyridis TaxID=115357 RepID=UPI001E27968E|nr:FUN14 domain-containing protein 1-like [Harmonia axyridis]